MDGQSDTALLHAPLHDFVAEDWAGWYPAAARLLLHEDARTRAAAIERLAMGVFWSEHSRSSAPPSDREQAERDRTHWLLDTLNHARMTYPDLLSEFLAILRYQGDSPPHSEVLLRWLGDLRDQTPGGIMADKIDGAIIMVGGLAPWTGSILPPALDHASDYVRACAACRLGRQGFGLAKDNGLDADALAALTEKEIARPGIAGPFWSGSDLGYEDPATLGFDPVDWMLTIIERRSGDEPASLPFNGIDFHIHELAAGHPDAVRRLIALGRMDVALMAATEIRADCPEMTELLGKLAEWDDPAIALSAQVHLAHYHGVVHPKADPLRLRHLPHWRDNARAIIIRYGEAGHHFEQAVIFPRDGLKFNNAAAWALIDTVLPPELRGELVPHYLAGQDDEPAAFHLGQDELRLYASGATVALIGAPDGDGWQRIDMGSRKPDGRWQPWTWT